MLFRRVSAGRDCLAFFALILINVASIDYAWFEKLPPWDLAIDAAFAGVAAALYRRSRRKRVA